MTGEVPVTEQKWSNRTGFFPTAPLCLIFTKHPAEIQTSSAGENPTGFQVPTVIRLLLGGDQHSDLWKECHFGEKSVTASVGCCVPSKLRQRKKSVYPNTFPTISSFWHCYARAVTLQYSVSVRIHTSKLILSNLRWVRPFIHGIPKTDWSQQRDFARNFVEFSPPELAACIVSEATRNNTSEGKRNALPLGSVRVLSYGGLRRHDRRGATLVARRRRRRRGCATGRWPLSFLFSLLGDTPLAFYVYGPFVFLSTSCSSEKRSSVLPLSLGNAAPQPSSRGSEEFRAFIFHTIL